MLPSADARSAEGTHKTNTDMQFWVRAKTPPLWNRNRPQRSDTVVFPPTSAWEFTKMMEQADSSYTMGTCEYTGDTFTGSFSGANMGVGIKSANKISLAGFKTLHVEFTSSALESGSQFSVYVQNTIPTAGDVIDHIATSGELTAGAIDIDLSGISGSYYILIGAIAWYNRNVSITITNVTLKGGTTA